MIFQMNVSSITLSKYDQIVSIDLLNEVYKILDGLDFIKNYSYDITYHSINLLSIHYYCRKVIRNRI